VFLLPHTADFGGHIGTHLARQYQAGDGGRQFDERQVADDVAYIVTRHELAVELVGKLYCRHGPDENRDQANNDQRTDADVVHLPHGFFPVHDEFLRAAEGLFHHDQVAAQMTEIIVT